MKLDELPKTLLEKIFKASVASSKGLRARKFRAEHHEHLDLLDQLEQSGYIQKRDDNYYLDLLSICELPEDSREVQSLFWNCEHFFGYLREYYRERPGSSIELNRLAEIADMPRRDVNIALSYMVQAPIFSQCTTKFYAKEDASVTPSEDILRYRSFRELVEAMRSRHSGTIPVAATPVFVSLQDEQLGDFRFLLHPVIVDHALRPFENGHLREAVLNSVIAIFDLIRERTGIREDGDRLIGKAFSLEAPYLILSELDSESGRNDQKGFMQIFRGSFQGIRNPKAHSLMHDLTPVKAAQYLVFASLLARRVQDATLVKREGSQV